MTPVESFGQWVKQQRKAVRWTQQELAQQIGCARMTIQMIERGQRRPSAQIAELLSEVLDIPGAQRESFLFAARMALLPHTPTTTSTSSSLPALLVPLLGRDNDEVAIRDQLIERNTRLLTLVGPPGVGKTSLAIRVANTLQQYFTDGIVFVPLAPLQDSTLVVNAIAQALAVQDRAHQSLIETVSETLSDRQILLLIDNFEHVLSAGPLLVELLTKATNVSMLVTSRAHLGVIGEYLYAVKPLDLPHNPTASSMVLLEESSAVALFVARARAVNPHFVFDDAVAPVVAALCARLDGLPLAIELAAAQSLLLTPQTMLEHLEHYVPVFDEATDYRSDRQRSLCTALNWSYCLMRLEEQALLARLAVFSDGCTLDAIVAVSDADQRAVGSDMSKHNGTSAITERHIHTLNFLNTLVSHSLVHTSVGRQGAMRYTMLQIIREYAAEHLIKRGEDYIIRYQHAQYYAGIAEKAAKEFYATNNPEWYEMLDEEYYNLQAALTWSLEHEPVYAYRLCGALWFFWYTRGYNTEGRYWLLAVLEHPRELISSAKQAHIYRGIGILASVQGDYAQASEYLQQAVALYQELEDKEGMAHMMTSLGNLTSYQGLLTQSIAWHEQSLQLARDIGNLRGVAMILSNLGSTNIDLENYEQAQTLIEESLALNTQLDDDWGIASALANLGQIFHLRGELNRARDFFDHSLVLRRRLKENRKLADTLQDYGYLQLTCGDLEQAYLYFCESLHIRQQIGEKRGIVQSLEAFALLAAAQYEPQRAYKLLATATALRTVIGALLTPLDRRRIEQSMYTLSHYFALPQRTLEQIEAEPMSQSQAVQYALQGCQKVD
ncbi:MAG: tetratricopeptide repeat protein [Chloroflexota bacterium]